MSRIATARALAKNIIALMDTLGMEDYREFRRVYDLTTGLVDAINNGWVTGIATEGIEELTHLVSVLTNMTDPELCGIRNALRPGMVVVHRDFEGRKEALTIDEISLSRQTARCHNAHGATRYMDLIFNIASIVRTYPEA